MAFKVIIKEQITERLKNMMYFKVWDNSWIADKMILISVWVQAKFWAQSHTTKFFAEETLVSDRKLLVESDTRDEQDSYENLHEFARLPNLAGVKMCAAYINTVFSLSLSLFLSLSSVSLPTEYPKNKKASDFF